MPSPGIKTAAPVLTERRALIAVVALVTLASWAWIVPMARDMYGSMMGPSAWMMTETWDLPHLLLLVAMWIVMMAGMMLPSAMPTLLVYAAAARRRSDTGATAALVYSMAAAICLSGSHSAWARRFSQRGFSALLLLSTMMKTTSPLLSGGLLVAAGTYQFTPVKYRCLTACSSPIAFLMRRWREGASGAFRLGVEHGLLCVGCCWALMLLLFAGGVMNLAVIGAVTAIVLVEKIASFGIRTVRITGIMLIALGLWVTLR